MSVTYINCPFKDAASADLGLSLDLHEMQGLAAAHMRTPWGRVELRVLGASHQALVYQRPSRIAFAEAVACGQHAAKPLPKRDSVSARSCEWSFRSEVLHPPDVEFYAAELTGRAARAHNAVAGIFPGTESAVTALFTFQRDAGRQHFCGWETYHVYPEAGEVVRTHSIYRNKL